jgi:hypothetical protein
MDLKESILEKPFCESGKGLKRFKERPRHHHTTTSLGKCEGLMRFDSNIISKHCHHGDGDEYACIELMPSSMVLILFGVFFYKTAWVKEMWFFKQHSPFDSDESMVC